ncbi:glutamyl-tRNA reductase [Georgenia sp. TF02-10]|uniref:glutamyl-tRNA reductase n=1 Tax=Georgenia sp. TF02-10 TaxID=2917725 RepID=UPI001FA81164|nr:glutamyl-tRNA reductase [Georgenia sp. TF02-10]UNX54724.1 glutamyl-tRNA reductase [Georgenia sp. TF02-10]
MVLVLLSANHHDLDLSDVERLSVGAAAMGPAAVAASPAVRGAVVLATCNRLELYLDATDTEAARAAGHQAVAVASGTAPAEVARLMRSATGEAAVAHAFAVAAGLDSLVVGEREIIGQVRRALAAARAAGTTTPLLERVLQHATRTSRRIAVSTDLARAGRSVVAVALDLAADRAGAAGAVQADAAGTAAPGAVPADRAGTVLPGAAGTPETAPAARAWAGRRTLLMGTGAYAGASLAALRARGATDVRVWSASGRAETFAADHGVRPAPTDLGAGLAAADLVVTCRGTGTPLLDVPTVAAARAARARTGAPEPLVLVDLALHHDVDPAVADLDGVLLVDLGAVRAHAPVATTAEVARARALVDAGVRELAEETAERRMDAAVVALRESVEAAVAEEIERLPGGAVSADRAAHALRRLAARLVHTPTVRARAAGRQGRDEEHLRALEQALGLVVPGPADDDGAAPDGAAAPAVPGTPEPVAVPEPAAVVAQPAVNAAPSRPPSARPRPPCPRSRSPTPSPPPSAGPAPPPADAPPRGRPRPTAAPPTTRRPPSPAAPPRES